MNQPENTAREGAFSIAMGQMGPALDDMWRGKWTVLKLGLALLVAAVLIEMFAILLSPGASFSDYTQDFQEQVLDEFNLDIDIDGGRVEGDDNSVEDIMYDIAEGLEESDAEQVEKLEDEANKEPDESLEEFSFKDAIREGIEEEGHIGPNPIEAPIYTAITSLGSFALYFVQYIIVIFAVSQTVLNKRQVSIGECLEAVRTCPFYFYAAAIKKMLWIMGPVLVMVAIGWTTAAVMASPESGMLIKGVATLIMIVGGIASIVWMIRRMMSYMYIEFYALFHQMRFAQAKEASTAIMHGNRNGLFWAWMVVAIAFSVVFGFAAMLGLFLMIVPAIALGLVAKWTAIVIGAIGFIFFMAIIQIAPTYFFISWMYRIWQALLGREEV